MLKPAGNVILISELTSVEMVSVFARLQREKKLPDTQVAALKSKFLFDSSREYLIVPMDGSVFTIAQSIVANHPLRTLDALQLASARQARSFLKESIVFVSADNRLLAIASAEGFITENPLLHP
jgi:predicted nucleic acid-binding protein